MTTGSPALARTDSLRGVTIGISVSDSADLPRLGLSTAHCDHVVAELARAVFLAGGTLVYGGRLVPPGFTDILLAELHEYREDRDALVLCVPETEHRRLSDAELIRRESDLAPSAELVCLDAGGSAVDIRNRPTRSATVDVAAALSAMRNHVTRRCDARVVVGGKLTGFEGAAPGVLEEARLSLAASQPLYVAGGFGGAAAAVAAALDRDDASVTPPDYPHGVDEHRGLLDELGALARAGAAPDGLTPDERRQLAMSHRPGDIASLVVLGLARVAR